METYILTKNAYTLISVSYTHLDVYKRQGVHNVYNLQISSNPLRNENLHAPILDSTSIDGRHFSVYTLKSLRKKILQIIGTITFKNSRHLFKF